MKLLFKFLHYSHIVLLIVVAIILAVEGVRQISNKMRRKNSQFNFWNN